MLERPKIGIALGSGAARGLCHIGVLMALEENNIDIDYVTGCSAGALIGSLYCSGISPQAIANMVKEIDRKIWVDLTVPRRGFIKGEKIEEIIKLLTKNKNLEELEKKLQIVATDLKTSTRVIFKEGPIYKAVRASISIPGVFIPIKQNDMVLVDGAVTDRVPASLLKDMGADIIIAVDTGFSAEPGRINHIFDVILQSIDVMAKQMLPYNIIDADILVEPPVSHINPSRFDLVDEGVQAGYEATLEKINEIKDIINSYNEGLTQA